MRLPSVAELTSSAFYCLHHRSAFRFRFFVIGATHRLALSPGWIRRALRIAGLSFVGGSAAGSVTELRLIALSRETANVLAQYGSIGLGAGAGIIFLRLVSGELAKASQVNLSDTGWSGGHNR